MLKFIGLAVLAASFAAAPALANGLQAEQVIERVESIKSPDGKIETKFVVADRAVPGDELIYRLKFVNTGADAADDVVLTLPVPEEIAYVDGTADGSGTAIEFSVDNGKSFAGRRSLQVIENGASRPANATDITHIRFTFASAIAPKQAGELTFRAVLE